MIQYDILFVIIIMNIIIVTVIIVVFLSLELCMKNKKHIELSLKKAHLRKKVINRLFVILIYVGGVLKRQNVFSSIFCISISC